MLKSKFTIANIANMFDSFMNRLFVYSQMNLLFCFKLTNVAYINNSFMNRLIMFCYIISVWGFILTVTTLVFLLIIFKNHCNFLIDLKSEVLKVRHISWS